MEKEWDNSMATKTSARPVFVNTNLETRLVISTSSTDTVGDLRGKIKNEHFFCFPHFGAISIGALMVKRESLFYHLPDSIFVETAFHGSNETWYLLAEVFTSDMCNERECIVLSENLELSTQPKSGDVQMQFEEKNNVTVLDVQHGQSMKRKQKIVTKGLQVKEGDGQFNNNKECTDLVAVTEEKVMLNERFEKDHKTPGSVDKTLDARDSGKSKKKRKELIDLNEDLAKSVLLKSRKQESLIGNNDPTDDDNVHVMVKELGSGRKHETNSRVCIEEGLQNGARKESNGLQGKTDDARECDSEENIKCKRKRSSKNVPVDEREICTNDVNGVPQITNHSHLQEHKCKETGETLARECDTEKKLNRKRKKSSKHVLGDGDQEIYTKDVNGELQANKHDHRLEYKCRKTEKTCGMSVVLDKNAKGTDAVSGPMKCLDLVTQLESHQQCHISGKHKNKCPRTDLDRINGQGRVSIEQVQKNDIVVNSGKGKGDERISDVRNEKGRGISSENGGMTYLNMQHLKENSARDLEHIPEIIGTTAMANGQSCNDKVVKSSKNSPSKKIQQRIINIENRGKDEVVAKGKGASVLSDENCQTRNAMSATVKDMDISNQIENHQQCKTTGKKKNKRTRNDLSSIDAQEGITIEKVSKNDIGVNNGKGEADESTPDAGNKNRRDIPSENGGVIYKNIQHSKNIAAKDLEHIENCNIEKVKSSKNSLSTNSQERTINVVEREVVEVAAKGGNSTQNVSDEKKEHKDAYPLPKSKGSPVLDTSDRSQSRKAAHGNNAVVRNKQTVDQKLAQSRKAPTDVGCKVKKTEDAVTSCGLDISNTNHSFGQTDDTGSGGLKLQSTAGNSAQSIQVEKLDTNDLSYRKSPKEHQGDANVTEKLQSRNKKVFPIREIIESHDHNLKKTESTTYTTQSSEQKQDNDIATKSNRPKGEDGLCDRRNNSVNCHSREQTPVFVANDICGDSQCPREEHGTDGMSGKLQLEGKTHNGFCMNKEISKNTISCQKEKSFKKPKNNKHSKKNHISLFRSVSDETTEEENENDSYTMSSSSKRLCSDSSDSHESDTASRETISKNQSIKPQADWEPSRSGARLSTAVGLKEVNGGTGSIHSRFANLLAKKTGLGELFKIARAQQKPQSGHFDGDFMADDSPSVDVVLETQDSQIDPVFNAPDNRELPSSPIVADKTKEDSKLLNAKAPKTKSASKSPPDGIQKVPGKSNSSFPLDKPSNSSVQLKVPRKASNR